jgi:6-phosphogluconolactonase
MSKRFVSASVAIVGTAVLAVLTSVTSRAFAASGAVYTMTNPAGPNSVVVYQRSVDGVLGPSQSIATGGMGTGASLGSQGSMALTQDDSWLLAVNAGSNNVSVFSVNGSQLTLSSTAPSGGTTPVSITENSGTVFVLNAGGTPNITGFHLSDAGVLVPIPGDQAAVPGVGPAEVSFNRDGTLLAVTEKTSNTIVVFGVDGGGLFGPFISASSGVEPFGFAFGNHDLLLVSEADGGAANASSVSSYQADEGGGLHLVTASLPTTQTAACWLVVTGDGRFAYTGNTGSASISSIAVSRDGSLALLNGAAGTAPSGTSPTDLALSAGSHYLYNLASGTISGFRVAADGSLSPVNSVSGLPSSTVGLAAR